MNPIIVAMLLVVWIHWFSDFVVQSGAMATKKSKSVRWLAAHVLTYSILFFAFFGWEFALVNAVAHFAIDFVTSKLTAYFYAREQRRPFFIIIGFDQALHFTVFLLTLGLVK